MLLAGSDNYDGNNFFTTLPNGVRAATPLLLALAVVELSDVVRQPAGSGQDATQDCSDGGKA